MSIHNKVLDRSGDNMNSDGSWKTSLKDSPIKTSTSPHLEFHSLESSGIIKSREITKVQEVASMFFRIISGEVREYVLCRQSAHLDPDSR